MLLSQKVHFKNSMPGLVQIEFKQMSEFPEIKINLTSKQRKVCFLVCQSPIFAKRNY